jgi:hypothetical protein
MVHSGQNFGEEAAVSFVQVIEYETDRPDEIMALGESRRPEMPEAPEGFRVTGAFARQFAALCTSEPRFYNLDVIATMP